MQGASRRPGVEPASASAGPIRELHVFDELAALHAAAAERIALAAARSIAASGRFLLVLAGGATPLDVYARLASHSVSRIDWGRVDIFWGDERCVPPDHDESNYGNAATSLLRHIPIPLHRVHRIRGEQTPARAAAEYDAALASFFGAATPTDPGVETTFDLVLLGMGTDGHTASLFPGSPALDAGNWAVPALAPAPATTAQRVTLTLSAINASRECIFLVSGDAKRKAVAEVFGARSHTDEPRALLPAARVQPRERSLWFLDGAAAGALEA